MKPKTLKQYIGQERVKQILNLVIQGALLAERLPPHLLFVGPPGTGKTTLAQVIANELGVPFISIMAPMLKTIDDLINLFNSQKETYRVILIDEIHSLPSTVEERLYTILEDWTVEIDIGYGLKKYRVPYCMIIGATTKLGNVSKPLRDRFTIIELEEYTQKDIALIIYQAAILRGYEIETEAIIDIVLASKNVPRLALNILNRCIDNAIINNKNIITLDIVTQTLQLLGIDKNGLEERDYRYLLCLAQTEKPLGINSIVTYLNIDRQTIEGIIEPYLIQNGLIVRTPRGREITIKGIEVLKEKYLGGKQNG